MALPVNNTPTFNLVIPSTGKSVRYRPFLIKEEKHLLIAQQSEDLMVMIDTLKEVIKSCVLDDIDVDALATFDIEYMFTQIRAKSVGEIIELLFPCDEDHGEQNDKAIVKVKIDLTSIIVEKAEDHSNKIELFGDVGVVMKYPTIDGMKRLEKTNTEDLDAVFGVIADSIDFIYQGEELYYAKEQSKEELLQFLNNLTSDQFMNIQKFFATMPRIKKQVQYNCPICGKAHDKTLEGMQSFF
jgi:rubrerythrin